MEYILDLNSDAWGTALDPCRYVRLAEQALVQGSRDEAMALVAKAYLAFDLVLATCDDVRLWSRA